MSSTMCHCLIFAKPQMSQNALLWKTDNTPPVPAGPAPSSLSFQVSLVHTQTGAISQVNTTSTPAPPLSECSLVYNRCMRAKIRCRTLLSLMRALCVFPWNVHQTKLSTVNDTPEECKCMLKADGTSLQSMCEDSILELQVSDTWNNLSHLDCYQTGKAKLTGALLWVLCVTQWGAVGWGLLLLLFGWDPSPTVCQIHTMGWQYGTAWYSVSS